MWDGRIGTKKSRRRLNKEIVFATTDIGITGYNGRSCLDCNANLHTYSFGLHLVIGTNRFLVHVSPVQNNYVTVGDSLVVLETFNSGDLTEREQEIVAHLAAWDWPAEFAEIPVQQLDEEKHEAVAPELQVRDAPFDRQLANHLPRPVVLSHNKVRAPAEHIDSVESTLSESQNKQTEQGSLDAF